MKSYSLGDIASRLNLRLIGDPDCQIQGLGTLASANRGDISFLSNPSYLGQLANTSALRSSSMQARLMLFRQMRW